MDNKRLFLAIALSIVIFIGWNALATYMGWVVPPAPVTASQNATTASATNAQQLTADPLVTLEQQAVQRPVFAPTSGRNVTVDTPLYKAVFHTNGAVLREFTLKKYKLHKDKEDYVQLISPEAAAELPMSLLIAGGNSAITGTWSFDGADLTIAKGQQGSLRFTGMVDGIQVERVYTFTADNYTIAEKLNVLSATDKNLHLGFTMSSSNMASAMTVPMIPRLKYMFLGGAKPEPQEDQINLTRAAWLQESSFSQENNHTDLAEGKRVPGSISWGGTMNNYFLCAISMVASEDNSLYLTFKNGVFHTILGKPSLLAKANEKITLDSVYYIGPKESKSLDQAPNFISRALDYGFFTIIAKPLVAMLQFFYSYVGNYGVAIILMTIVIKLIFWPLSQKSYKSMEQMKKIQPEMTKLREKFGDDKETLNKEMMQLYKTHKVNPAGGCLPIVVQIPVFFGLYQALLNAIELRHAPFVEMLPFTNITWIADLAASDPTFITPLIMGASMFLQQKMSPAPADPTQAKIMMFMPIIFTVIFLGFPSGLVLYWLVNNVISIGQQWWQRKSAA